MSGVLFGKAGLRGLLGLDAGCSDDDMMVVLVAADADDVGHALKEFLRREDEVPELLVIEVGTEQELRLDGDSPA